MLAFLFSTAWSYEKKQQSVTFDNHLLFIEFLYAEHIYKEITGFFMTA